MVVLYLVFLVKGICTKYETCAKMHRFHILFIFLSCTPVLSFFYISLLLVSGQLEDPDERGGKGINFVPGANLNLEYHDVKKRSVEDIRSEETH